MQLVGVVDVERGSSVPRPPPPLWFKRLHLACASPACAHQRHSTRSSVSWTHCGATMGPLAADCLEGGRGFGVLARAAPLMLTVAPAHHICAAVVPLGQQMHAAWCASGFAQASTTDAIACTHPQRGTAQLPNSLAVRVLPCAALPCDTTPAPPPLCTVFKFVTEDRNLQIAAAAGEGHRRAGAREGVAGDRTRTHTCACMSLCAAAPATVCPSLHRPPRPPPPRAIHTRTHATPHATPHAARTRRPGRRAGLPAGAARLARALAPRVARVQAADAAGQAGLGLAVRWRLRVRVCVCACLVGWGGACCTAFRLSGA
jgi:hypothetical protein